MTPNVRMPTHVDRMIKLSSLRFDTHSAAPLVCPKEVSEESVITKKLVGYGGLKKMLRFLID